MPVYVSSDNDTEEHLVYALLDTQSDSTFVVEEIAQKLKAESFPTRLKISTMTSDVVTNCRKYVGLKVRALDSNKWVKLPPTYSKAYIPTNKNHIPTSDSIQHWDHLSRLRGKLPTLQDCEVGLLIGFNCPEALAPLEVILGKPTEPYAQKTALGWCIVGQTSSTESSATLMHVPSCVPQTSNAAIVHRTRISDISNSDIIDALQHDFKDTHEADKEMSQDEIKFLRILDNSITQDQDKFYQMPLPF
jgi:hypothetical protein